MSDLVAKAFEEIKREDFVPEDMKPLASLDQALPIGYGQTISQPFVVAFMLNLLGLTQGDKVLDVGAGSGWTTALLASVVGKLGKVVAIEIIPELAKIGERNVTKYSFIKEGRVLFLCADGSGGYAPEAPYDAVLVSAALSTKGLPKAFKEQVKVGGGIVVPVQNSIWVFTKRKQGFEEKEYPGFVFVPFI